MHVGCAVIGAGRNGASVRGISGVAVQQLRSQRNIGLMSAAIDAVAQPNQLPMQADVIYTQTGHVSGVWPSDLREVVGSKIPERHTPRDLGHRTRGLRVTLCVRLLPDNAWRCRFVRDSAHFAAAWCRALSAGTATSEQTWPTVFR